MANCNKSSYVKAKLSAAHLYSHAVDIICIKSSL